MLSGSMDNAEFYRVGKSDRLLGQAPASPLPRMQAVSLRFRIIGKN